MLRGPSFFHCQQHVYCDQLYSCKWKIYNLLIFLLFLVIFLMSICPCGPTNICRSWSLRRGGHKIYTRKEMAVLLVKGSPESSKSVCLNKQDCAIKTSGCKNHGSSVDCSLGRQLAFSGTDKHLSFFNSWCEAENLLCASTRSMASIQI